MPSKQTDKYNIMIEMTNCFCLIKSISLFSSTLSMDTTNKFVNLFKQLKTNEHKRSRRYHAIEEIQLEQLKDEIAQSKVKRVSSCRSFEMLPSLSSSSSAALSSITSETSLIAKNHSCFKLNSDDREVLPLII
jgi:NAD(P)H-nitrite reductase large subunit